MSESITRLTLPERQKASVNMDTGEISAINKPTGITADLIRIVSGHLILSRDGEMVAAYSPGSWKSFRTSPLEVK